MVFGLTIGTDRAAALQVRQAHTSYLPATDFGPQKSIQDELAKRGYGNDSGMSCSPPAHMSHTHERTDIVMAEYITIMIINNKTPGQSYLSSFPRSPFLTHTRSPNHLGA